MDRVGRSQGHFVLTRSQQEELGVQVARLIAKMEQFRGERCPTRFGHERRDVARGRSPPYRVQREHQRVSGISGCGRVEDVGGRRRRGGFGQVLLTTGNIEEDMWAIQSFYKGITAKYPEKSSLAMLYNKNAA